MSHHRNTSSSQLADGREEVRPALELHCISSRLFHDTDRRVQGTLGADLIAAKGHVYHDEGSLDAANHTGSVVDHLVEGDGKGRRMSSHYIGCRIPDEKDVNTSCIKETRHCIVVGGEHRDRLTLGFHSCQTKGGYLLRFRLVLGHFSVCLFGDKPPHYLHDEVVWWPLFI